MEIEKELKEQNADYHIYTDSTPIRSAQEGASRYKISLSETTPTLILKSKDKYYAAIICGDRRISFEKLKQILNVDSIRLADPKTVFELTGANVGEVSLINRGMTTLVDVHVLNNKSCYGGLGISNKTLRINTEDLIRITRAQVLDFCK